MCGRFTQRADSKRVAKEFKVAEVPAVDVRYNIAPTQEVLTVYEREDGREATFFKWGLVPSWAKDASMGARLINARSETVAEKPAFRQAFKRRRCIQKEVQPGTLIHDSTIFDGVDERQVANASS